MNVVELVTASKKTGRYLSAKRGGSVGGGEVLCSKVCGDTYMLTRREGKIL